MTTQKKPELSGPFAFTVSAEERTDISALIVHALTLSLVVVVALCRSRASGASWPSSDLHANG